MIKIMENYPKWKEDKILLFNRWEHIGKFKIVSNIENDLEEFFLKEDQEKTLVKIKNKVKISILLNEKENIEKIGFTKIQSENIKEAYFKENNGTIIVIVEENDKCVICELRSLPYYETEAFNKNIEIFLYNNEIKIDKDILKNELNKYREVSKTDEIIEMIDEIKIYERKWKNSKEYIVRDGQLEELLSVKVYRKLEENEKNDLIKNHSYIYNKRLLLNKKFRNMVKTQTDNLINDFNYIIKIQYTSNIACIFARFIKEFLLNTQDMYELKVNDMFLGIGDGGTAFVKIKKETKHRVYDKDLQEYFWENDNYSDLVDAMVDLQMEMYSSQYLYVTFFYIIDWIFETTTFSTLIYFMFLVGIPFCLIYGFLGYRISIMIIFFLCLFIIFPLVGYVLYNKIDTIKTVLQYKDKKICKGSNFKGYAWFEIIKEKIFEKTYNKKKQEIFEKYGAPKDLDYNGNDLAFFSENEVIYNFYSFLFFVEDDLMKER